VRPTAGRVREALFSIVGERVREARVLDAYSGSGALGFEALSRGAREVVFIDSGPGVVRALRRSAGDLAVAARCRILQGRVLDLLGRPGASGPFDLILADPPYAAGESGRFLSRAAGLIAPDGLLVLERDLHAPAPEGGASGLVHLRTARYGTNCLEFFALPAPRRGG
jgi:16S rRNA (guanine966-N2)-methyltransferase